MKQSKLFILLFVMSLFVRACSAFVGSTRELAIFFEYGESENIHGTLGECFKNPSQPVGLSAASYLCLNALYQDVPVLVPAPLWQNIVDHKNLFDDAVGLKKTAFLGRYGHTAFLGTSKCADSFQRRCFALAQWYDVVTNALKSSTNIKHFESVIADQTKQIFSKHDDLALGRLLMCSAVPIERYIIKRIEPSGGLQLPFYLFIPHRLIQSLSGDMVEQGLSSRERLLGMKIDHLTTIDDPLHVSRVKNNDKRYQELLVPALKEIFVSRKEDDQARWAIYVMGHGTYSDKAKEDLARAKGQLAALELERESAKEERLPLLNNKIQQIKQRISNTRQGNRIIGLPLDRFGECLRFFDTQITTKLLFYSSCTAGGKQFIDAFCDEHNVPLKLSYTVVSDTLFEAPSLTAIPCVSACDQTTRISVDRLVDWEKRAIILDTPYDFRTFFDLLRSSEHDPALISHTLHSVAPALRSTDIDAEKLSLWMRCSKARAFRCLKQNKLCLQELACLDANNLPSVRLSYTTHFGLVDGGRSCIELSNTCCKETCVTDGQVVLLCSQELPAYIDCIGCQKSFPVITSFIAGKAMHKIKALDAGRHTLSAVIKGFFSYDNLQVSKLICIDQLKCINDLKTKSPGRCCVLDQVMLFNAVGLKNAIRPQSGFLCRLNNRYYGALWDSDKAYSADFASRFIFKSDGAVIASNIIKYFDDVNGKIPSLYARHCMSLENICDWYQSQKTRA